jgi:hypothetical protein
MRPPIKLCANGHKICSICRPKVSHCPTCRDKFVDTRNLALEALARQAMYPCKYRCYGCTETFSHDKIVGHQATCQYIPQVCPVAKLAIGKCSWTGSYKDIKGHLKENHLEECCEYIEGDFKFICNLPFYSTVSSNMKLFCFLFAYNEVFFFLLERRDPILYAVLLCVGPSGNAAKYKYKVTLVNKDDTESVAVMHLTVSSVEVLDNVYRSGRCGLFLNEVVSRFIDEECNVKFNLEIIRVGN